MLKYGMFWAPDSGAGDSPGNGPGDTPGSGIGTSTTPVGPFDPSTLVWPLKVTAVYGAGWKVGDTLPALVVDLSDGAGTVIDLTGATVLFRMRPVYGGALSLTGTAAPDANQTLHPGRVVYTFGAGDLAQDGQMCCEFTVTFPGGGGVATFPDVNYFIFTVYAAIT